MYAGALLLTFTDCAGFLVGVACRRNRDPVLIARILNEERTLSAEFSGYNDYCRADRELPLPPRHQEKFTGPAQLPRRFPLPPRSYVELPEIGAGNLADRLQRSPFAW
jgi:hypothetical protein